MNQRHFSPRNHPWWRHVPPAERGRRAWHSRRMRIAAWLRQRRHQLVLSLLFYGLLCLLPLLIGQPHLSAYALLPVLLVPPVAYLGYLLAWHEFHR